MSPLGDDNLIDRIIAAAVDIDKWLVRRAAIALGLFCALFILIAVDFSPKAISGLEVSKPSPVTVRAPRSIALVDAERTQERRRQAAETVSPVRRYDVNSPTQAKAAIADFYLQLWQILSNEILTGSQRRAEVTKLVPHQLKAEEITWLLSLGRDDVKALERQTIEFNSMVMTDKIDLPALPLKRDEVKRRAMVIEDLRGRKLVGLVAAAKVRVNSFVDKELTNNAIAQAVDKAKPVVAKKLKGETIVTEGEIVTPLQERFLRELGLTDNLVGATAGQVVGQLLVSLALMALGLVYLREFQPRVHRDNRLLLLIFVVLTTVSALAKGLAPLFPPYFIPVAGAAMLTTILVRPSAGIMMAVTTGLVTGMIVNSPQYWFFAFMTGLFAVYLTAHISQRSDLTRAGLWLMLVSGCIALTMSLIRGDTGLDLLVSAGWGVVGGFAATILTIGTLQFLEHTFNITTDMKLLELSNPTQPLLKELMVNAPGTYNHSIITGNLVESVAPAIGANPLLARTGAYYHDIGKIKRPFFFVENQYGDNPHDKTQPNLSYLIIAAHVKEGAELAKKHRLPEEIVDIICQHHGTTLVSYFYSRAKEKASNSNISEHQFRYQGDKPKSKEAALIMLADAVEAAARALPKPTHSRIEQLVRRIVKDRLRDGQLDSSELTLGDLESIVKGYTQTLTTMYHTRIEYPAADGKTTKKRRVVVGAFGRKPGKRAREASGP